MNVCTIATRYALLRAEIERQLAASTSWAGLPRLLDELHALRGQYYAARMATLS